MSLPDILFPEKQPTHMDQSLKRDLNFLPLREPTFLILLSLAAGGKHGYSILQDVEALSHGKVTLSTGTLYEALSRLLDQGLIERFVESEPEEGANSVSPPHPGKPRKSYRLTATGRELLKAEIRRMESLITAVKQKLGEEWG
jgi:DNA-binding PadR family transcriptional regulator